MQVKWLLSSWLFEVLPSFFLSQELKLSNSSSKSSLRSPSSLNQAISDLSKPYSKSNPYWFLGNTHIGAAWSATVHTASGLLPFLAAGKDHGLTQRLPDRPRSEQNFGGRWEAYQLSNIISVLAGYGGIHGDKVAFKFMIYVRCFFTVFGDIVHKADRLCFPAALALGAVIMPPLDRSSKLVPRLIDDLDDGETDKEAHVCVNKNAEALSQQAVCSLKVDSVANMIVEPKTGAKFPSALCTNVGDDASLKGSSQVLVGVGIKSVTLVKLKTIKIYAFGVYIKPDELKAQLGEKYSAFLPEELKNKPGFYEDLLRHNFDMTVRLVVHYKGLKMGMVRSAFDTSLRNRLRKIKGVEEDEGLPIFNSYFSENLSLSRGSVINFQWVAGNQLRTEIDGKLIGTISSRDFCRAFFDIYMGDPPVSLKAKQDIGEKLGHMLRGAG